MAIGKWPGHYSRRARPRIRISPGGPNSVSLNMVRIFTLQTSLPMVVLGSLAASATQCRAPPSRVLPRRHARRRELGKPRPGGQHLEGLPVPDRRPGQQVLPAVRERGRGDRRTRRRAGGGAGGGVGCNIEAGFGVNFSRKWIQLLGRFRVWKGPVHFTEAFTVSAMSNFVSWAEGAKWDISDIIHEDSIEIFRPLRFTPRIAWGSVQMRCKPDTKTTLNVTPQAGGRLPQQGHRVLRWGGTNFLDLPLRSEQGLL